MKPSVWMDDPYHCDRRLIDYLEKNVRTRWNIFLQYMEDGASKKSVEVAYWRALASVRNFEEELCNALNFYDDLEIQGVETDIHEVKNLESKFNVCCKWIVALDDYYEHHLQLEDDMLERKSISTELSAPGCHTHDQLPPPSYLPAPYSSTGSAMSNHCNCPAVNVPNLPAPCPTLAEENHHHVSREHMSDDDDSSDYYEEEEVVRKSSTPEPPCLVDLSSSILEESTQDTGHQPPYEVINSDLLGVFDNLCQEGLPAPLDPAPAQCEVDGRLPQSTVMLTEELPLQLCEMPPSQQSQDADIQLSCPTEDMEQLLVNLSSAQLATYIFVIMCLLFMRISDFIFMTICFLCIQCADLPYLTLCLLCMQAVITGSSSSWKSHAVKFLAHIDRTKWKFRRKLGT